MAESATKRAKTAPEPDDPRKPDSPTDITKPSWKYVARKTLREFTSDQCLDLSAALTYYGTLAVFPALLAFVSIIGLIGDPAKTTSSLLDLAGGLVPSSTLDSIKEPLAKLATSPAAGVTFVTGIVGALWSASGYVGAFSRAMNRIYSIQEGRPIWKLRPVTLAVTVVAIIAAVVAAALLVLSGPILQSAGDALHVGPTFVIVFSIVKWPIIAALAIFLLAVLYYATPNIRQPHFKWMSVGSLVALIVWVVASVGFAFYAANFSKYNSTYGALGGIIVFLLWVWISNNALLFGAELDAELERGRELQAGIAAEETIQLPPRDTRQSDKKMKQHNEDVRRGRQLRAEVPESKRAEPAQPPKTRKQQKAADAEREEDLASRKESEKRLKGAQSKIAKTIKTQAVAHALKARK